MTIDPYLDPVSGVLRNRLGVTDPDLLHAVEAGLTVAALADLGVRTLPGDYEAGWPIDWSGLDPDGNVEASMASLRGDNAPLHGMLDALVSR